MIANHNNIKLRKRHPVEQELPQLDEPKPSRELQTPALWARENFFWKLRKANERSRKMPRVVFKDSLNWFFLATCEQKNLQVHIMTCTAVRENLL